MVGIFIQAGSTQNRILSNAATGSGSRDLQDHNGNGDQNTCSSNTFGTKSPGCIK